MIPTQSKSSKGVNIGFSNKSYNNSNILSCLENSAIYNLSLTIQQQNISNFNKYNFISESDTIIIDGKSPHDAISFLFQKYYDKKDDFFSFIKQNNNIEQIKNKNIFYPINSDIIKYNSFEMFNKCGTILIIKFNSIDSNCILSNNDFSSTFSCVMNAKINDNLNYLFSNDLHFSIPIKKILKSISNILDNKYNISSPKNKFNKNNKDNEYFIPIIKNSNIGIIIQSNNNFSKSNFDKVIYQDFLLKEIYVALNINSLFQMISSEDFEFFPYKSYYSINSTKNTSENFNQNNFIKYQAQEINMIPYHYLQNFNYNNNQILFRKNFNNNYSNDIILNSDNIFSKTLFNIYSDKTDTTCNFQILKDFLKINKNLLQHKKNNIKNFIKLFNDVSCLSLVIPIFKLNGNMTTISLTPSLQSLKLYIKDRKLSSIMKKKIKDNNIITVKGFNIFLMNDNIIKIFYKEQRPYYLTESFYDTISELLNEIKEIKKIRMNKIIIDKSYISLSWNIIKNFYFCSNRDSFESYYLFDGTLLGIISNLSEKNGFWIRNIKEITNRKRNTNYQYLIKENNEKVNKFLRECD